MATITYHSNTDTIATGKIVTGTAVAAIYVECGFKPNYVMCVNVSSGGKCKMEYFTGMTAGYGIKTATDGTISIVTSGGITQNSITSSSAALGFSTSTDADVFAASEDVYFVALG